MIRRPPRSTLSSSSAASDVYKRQAIQPVDTHELVPVGRGGRETHLCSARWWWSLAKSARIVTRSFNWLQETCSEKHVRCARHISKKSLLLIISTMIYKTLVFYLEPLFLSLIINTTLKITKKKKKKKKKKYSENKQYY
eukprot:TRINITY_DN1071_c0_g1_i2.p1 TRINITY_DN1071_c0_g1~~TRINITY_DN1071_c0_g1_i2.p1  ORF type:complete len:139 (-),score=11.94 TRINITY_DN1071_c0_g1_i2:75-491(-)